MRQAATDKPAPHIFWIKCAAVVVAIAAVIVGGVVVWRKTQPVLLTKKAREYFEKGDYANAVLTARRSLQLNPFDQGASRLMVEITEKMQVPDALEWRRRVAELNPGDAGEAMAWAQTALRFGRAESAKQALAAVPENERNSAQYHAAAGLAALGGGKSSEAEKEFAAAVQLEPGNDLYQYNLATLHIQMPDAAKRKAGADKLAQLTASGRVQGFARRALVTDAITKNAWADALRISTELQKSGAAQFIDRLTHLDLLARAQSPELPAFLEETKGGATSAQPRDIAALVTWMRTHGRAAEALQWSERLDTKITGDPRVASARAECFVATQDWPALQKHVENADWIDLNFARLAYFARALNEQPGSSDYRTRWSGALGAAKRRDQLMQLAHLAWRWGWQGELRDTLWAAASAPAPQWALQMLHGLFAADGDTNGLLRVATRLSQVEPENDSARNNVAMLSLLLERDLERSTQTARELHAKAPANAGFASTYAFALHLAGRTDEALKVMQSLKPEQLREPPIAAYYALILRAAGRAEEAAPFAELGAKSQLLPEEKKLLSAAQAR